jgi:carbamate kinase
MTYGYLIHQSACPGERRSVTDQAPSRTAVIALGGNAITLEGQSGTYDEMLANCQAMVKSIAAIREAGWRVVITHGNGPQVGNLAVQQDEAELLVPGQPLYALGAMTQGLIGHLIETALLNERGQGIGSIVSVVTHVDVDPRDPAFSNPTKPIGPFYTLEKAQERSARTGQPIVEDAGRGYRVVVASPRPRRVLETDAITALVEQGFMVIAGGGGGIPVVDDQGTIRGVNAVIDKDRAAALLAAELKADALVLVTGVDAVLLDFGKPTQRELNVVTADEMRTHAHDGQFPAGSMGPKVEAAIDFVDARDGVAVITSANLMSAALDGLAGPGTHIVRSVRP